MSGPEMDHGHVAVLQPITNETHVATDSFDASPSPDDREALVELDLKNNATFGTNVAPLTTHPAEDASTISFVDDDKVDDIKGTATPSYIYHGLDINPSDKENIDLTSVTSIKAPVEVALDEAPLLEWEDETAHTPEPISAPETKHDSYINHESEHAATIADTPVAPVTEDAAHTEEYVGEQIALLNAEISENARLSASLEELLDTQEDVDHVNATFDTAAESGQAITPEDFGDKAQILGGAESVVPEPTLVLEELADESHSHPHEDSVSLQVVNADVTESLEEIHAKNASSVLDIPSVETIDEETPEVASQEPQLAVPEETASKVVEETPLLSEESPIIVSQETVELEEPIRPAEPSVENVYSVAEDSKPEVETSALTEEVILATPSESHASEVTVVEAIAPINDTASYEDTEKQHILAESEVETAIPIVEPTSSSEAEVLSSDAIASTSEITHEEHTQAESEVEISVPVEKKDVEVEAEALSSEEVVSYSEGTEWRGEGVAREVEITERESLVPYQEGIAVVVEGSIIPAVEEAPETAEVQLGAEPAVPVADLVEVTAETSSNAPAAVEEAAEVEHEAELPAIVTANDRAEETHLESTLSEDIIEDAVAAETSEVEHVVVEETPARYSAVETAVEEPVTTEEKGHDDAETTIEERSTNAPAEVEEIAEAELESKPSASAVVDDLVEATVAAQAEVPLDAHIVASSTIDEDGATEEIVAETPEAEITLPVEESLTVVSEDNALVKEEGAYDVSAAGEAALDEDVVEEVDPFADPKESLTLDSESTLDAAIPTSVSAKAEVVVEETPEAEHVTVQETSDVEIVAPVDETSGLKSEESGLIDIAIPTALAAEETLLSEPIAVETVVEAEPEAGSFAPVTLGEPAKEAAVALDTEIPTTVPTDDISETAVVEEFSEGKSSIVQETPDHEFEVGVAAEESITLPQESARVDLETTTFAIPATEENSSGEPVIIEDTVVLKPEEEISVPLAVNNSGEGTVPVERESLETEVTPALAQEVTEPAAAKDILEVEPAQETPRSQPVEEIVAPTEEASVLTSEEATLTAAHSEERINTEHEAELASAVVEEGTTSDVQLDSLEERHVLVDEEIASSEVAPVSVLGTNTETQVETATVETENLVEHDASAHEIASVIPLQNEVLDTYTVEEETKEVSSGPEDDTATSKATKEHAVLVEEFIAESQPTILDYTVSSAVQETETGAVVVGTSGIPYIAEDALKSKDEHVTGEAHADDIVGIAATEKDEPVVSEDTETPSQTEILAAGFPVDTVAVLAEASVQSVIVDTPSIREDTVTGELSSSVVEASVDAEVTSVVEQEHVETTTEAASVDQAPSAPGEFSVEALSSPKAEAIIPISEDVYVAESKTEVAVAPTEDMGSTSQAESEIQEASSIELIRNASSEEIAVESAAETPVESSHTDATIQESAFTKDVQASTDIEALIVDSDLAIEGETLVPEDGDIAANVTADEERVSTVDDDIIHIVHQVEQTPSSSEIHESKSAHSETGLIEDIVGVQSSHAPAVLFDTEEISNTEIVETLAVPEASTVEPTPELALESEQVAHETELDNGETDRPLEISEEIVPHSSEETADVMEETRVAATTESAEHSVTPLLTAPETEVERPKSPWTPSYSVTTQGPNDSGPVEDENEPEDLEQLPPLAIASDFVLEDLGVTPTMSVTDTEGANQEGAALVLAESTPNGPSMESAVEDLRPWTPSYSVTSQGSPMPSTRELETAELPSPPFSAEVVEDPAATTTEVAALLETSESLVSEVSSVEGYQRHSDPVEVEDQDKETEIPVLYKDTDEVTQETIPTSVPQLTVEGSSTESVVEQSRPWTPSYSVTSQGSLLQYTAELGKEELSSTSDTLDDEAVPASPQHPTANAVTEVEVEDVIAVGSTITAEAVVPVATSESFISEARAAEEYQVAVQAESKVELTEVSDEPVSAPTMLVTDTDDATEEFVPQLTVDVSANESAGEQQRPWTPSYSVTSQGSPMRYTEELGKEEFPAISDYQTENDVEELVSVHQPTGDVIEVVAEAEKPAAAVGDAHSPVFVDEVVIPSTASESFISEALSAADLQDGGAEGEFKETEVPEEASTAPTMLVTDTDEATQGSFPQLSVDVSSNESASEHQRPWTPSYSVTSQGSPMRYSAELDKDEGQTESAAAEDTRESTEVPTEVTEVVEESAAADHVSTSVIAEEAVVSVTTSESFIREASSVDEIVEDVFEKSEVEVPSEESSVAPTMVVTTADEAAQDTQLAVDIPSDESAIERPRPWTPSYSVTSQGSPMRYTEELKKEESPSIADAAQDEVVASSQPSGDVVEVIEESAVTTETAPDSVVIVEEAVIPAETSENVISEPELNEEPQSPVVEPVRDDSEKLSRTPSLLTPQEDAIPERPKSPWTPSYSVTRQGSGVIDSTADDADLDKLEQLPDRGIPVVAEPEQVTSVLHPPVFNVLIQGDSAADSQSDVTEASVISNAPETPRSDLTSSPDDVSDASVASSVVVPVPAVITTSVEKHQVFPQSASFVEEPAQEAALPRLTTDDNATNARSDTLSADPPRTRLESTASSRFFPGGWFSPGTKSPEEGRTSLDLARGEFIPVPAPVPGVSVPSKSTVAPPIAEDSDDSDSDDEEVHTKKGKWCIVM